MPGRTSWHSEPPATWLFNFNGLHQMFQAKGPPRNQNRRAPNPRCAAHPGSFPGFGHPSCWDGKTWVGDCRRSWREREGEWSLASPVFMAVCHWVHHGWRSRMGYTETQAFFPLSWSPAPSLDSRVLAMCSETCMSFSKFHHICVGETPMSFLEGRAGRNLGPRAFIFLSSFLLSIQGSHMG